MTVTTTLVSHVQALSPWLSIFTQGKAEGRRIGEEETWGRGGGMCANQCEKER